MGVRRVLPAIMLSAILLASGFGVNSAFADPPEKYKVRFNTDDPIVIDGSSSDNLFVGYHGKTKNLESVNSLRLVSETCMLDSNGDVIFCFNNSEFPKPLDSNTKFSGEINLGPQDTLAFVIDLFHTDTIQINIHVVTDAFTIHDSDSIIAIVQ